METGVITMEDLAANLNTLPSISFRLALYRAGERWRLHTLVLDVFPDTEERPAHAYEEQPAYAYEYGHFVFLRGKLPGTDVSAWVQHWTHPNPTLEVALDPLSENILAQDGSGRHYTFDIPSLSQPVGWNRHPSYASYDYSVLPWPYTRYSFPVMTSSNASSPHQGFLIGQGCPFFPDYRTAILSLVYGVDDVDRTRGFSANETILVRVAHTEAWLDAIHLSPTSLTVAITGSDVAGSRLEIGAPSDLRLFDERVDEPQTVTCPLPDGLPPELWIVLSHATDWLDYRQLGTRWTPFGSRPANVLVEPPDLPTRIQQLVAQGEGIGVEFKETIPPEKDKMHKTVAAFANGNGGVILLGVENGTGELKGFPGEGHKIKDDITQMIRNRVYPEPRTRIEVATVEHRQIVAIYVEKGDAPPYGLGAAPPQCYVRRGATTFPARAEEIRAIVLATQPTANNPLLGYVR